MNYFDRLRGGKESKTEPVRHGSRRRRIIRDILPPEVLPQSETPIAVKKPASPPSPQFQTQPLPPPPAARLGPPAAAKKTPEEIRREALAPPTEGLAAEGNDTRPSERPPADLIVERDLPVHTWEPESAAKKRLRRKILLWSSLFTILAVFAAPLVFFPKFSVTINPKTQSAAVGRMEITADTSISLVDANARRIPAMTITLEKNLQRDYEATGRKNVEEKAKSKVLVFNGYSSSPQALAANTRFQDSSGKIFRLPQGVLIPGAKVENGKIVPTSITVDLIADSAGEEYNIGPAELRISGFRGTPKYDGFYVKAESGFSGGFKGEVKTVTADDLKRASEDLTKRVFDELKAELQKKIPSGPDFVMPDGGREIIITKVQEPADGERFERFPVSVSARGRLAAVRRSHINAVISAVMLPKNSELNINFPERQNKLSFGEVRFGPEPSRITFYASGEFIYWRETNSGDLTKILQAASPQKAEAYLKSREEIESFQIKKFPAWLWFIPSRPGGLGVAIQPPA